MFYEVSETLTMHIMSRGEKCSLYTKLHRVPLNNQTFLTCHSGKATDLIKNINNNGYIPFCFATSRALAYSSIEQSHH